MTYSNDKTKFEILCECHQFPEYDGNETDELLKQHRQEADESGYDADLRFYFWVGNTHVRCEFNLYGLDFYVCSVRTKNFEEFHKITTAMEIIQKWFSDKTLDDISEDLYRRVETELGKQIFDKISEL